MSGFHPNMTRKLRQLRNSVYSVFHALGACNAKDFVERGGAVADPAKPVLAKPDHPHAHAMRAQLALGRGVVDELAHVVVEREQLVDAGAPLVAGEVAGPAARGAAEPLGDAAPEDGLLARVG